jgi:hypothetical protein
MTESAQQSISLVILDSDRRILVDRSGAVPALPCVDIPRFTRLAYSLTIAAREKYGLELFVITTTAANTESLPADGNPASLVSVCRLQSEPTLLPGRLEWLDPAKVESETLQKDGQLISRAFEEQDLYERGIKPSSFGQYAALDDLRLWYAPHLAKLGVRESSIQQWNGDPWFALFRIAVEPVGEAKPETPKALWFKAVGEPNTREFAVTQLLARECPWWFSTVVATKPEVNGWLAEEVDGHELDLEPDGRPWALTARVLAKIQTLFINREDELIDLGCEDWRIPRILERIDPFFESMIEIMARQTQLQPAALSPDEVRHVAQQCRDLCRQVEDIDIPYSLAHGDFSPHNVIVHNTWPVMIDWAEAYVTFPFISWEFFWNRTIKDHPEYAEWRERMHRNYAYRSWTSILGRNRVDEGLRYSPAMAVLVHALQGSEDTIHGAADPSLDKMRRSLVRRLQRELELLQPVGAL